MYPVEAGTKVMSMRQPYAVEHTILTSKQFHAFTGYYINKTFILYTIHGYKIHAQSTFPRSFIFAFNSRIDSLYLADWGKLFQSVSCLRGKDLGPVRGSRVWGLGSCSRVQNPGSSPRIRGSGFCPRVRLTVASGVLSQGPGS